MSTGVLAERLPFRALPDVEQPAAEPLARRRNEELLAGDRARQSASAMDALVRDNQALLHHILKRFAHSGEPYEDLLQVANLGLIKAARNYDVARGTRFSTYAVAVVDGEVRHYLRDSLLMRQPRWARRAYAEIQEAVVVLGHKLGRSPTVAEIATAVNITEAGVLEVMALSGRVEPEALDEVSYVAEADPPDGSVVHSLRAESFALPIEDRIALEAALARLSESQRRLIGLLFYREFTQREVAEALGLTTKKVSRELAKALSRLKDTMGRRVW